jgi:hypothetical protein
MSVRNKQRTVVEILTAENAPPIDIYRRIKVVYGDDCVDISGSTVRHWAAPVRDANLGHARLNYTNRRGRSRTATDEAHRNRIVVKENRRVFQQATVNITAVSRERVQAIIHYLGYRKLCARCVHRMFIEELKQKGWTSTDICCDMNVKVTNFCAALSHDEVKAAVKIQCRQQDAQFCRDGLMRITEIWRKSVDLRGDYV